MRAVLRIWLWAPLGFCWSQQYRDIIADPENVSSFDAKAFWEDVGKQAAEGVHKANKAVCLVGASNTGKTTMLIKPLAKLVGIY